jgi:hypothetical protein
MSSHHAVHAVGYEDAATPLTLGPAMEPEQAPGRNPLQKMAAMMRDQLQRLCFFRDVHGRAPQGERARAVTMLQVAVRSRHLWALAGGPSGKDLLAFGHACTALREELFR